MESKKTRKLEQYLSQRKVICGSVDSQGKDERILTTMACIKLNDDGLFEVSIEVYFPTIDISELNLRDETRYFPSLEEAVVFLESETGIRFSQMHKV
ncbi:MAG: hypothetical protein KF770_16370 [Anaerolineae bacterium]|nr:hypothetical protein [Anaerolineae bacterium]